MHKHFSGIQVGLWDMMWFCDYYWLISLFIIKCYFRASSCSLKGIHHRLQVGKASSLRGQC